MRFERFAVELTPFRMLRAAALALPIAFGLTAPTAAEPVFTDLIAQIHVGPGHAHSFEATQLFRDAGTNPRFTAVTFSTTDYYTNHGIDDGELVVQAKTAAELSAMSPPPSSPILVDVTVTMTNDENEEASGSFQFSTRYEQVAESPPQPAFSHSGTVAAAPGATLTYRATDLFDNAGEGAEITGTRHSNPDYYTLDNIQLAYGILEVDVKTTVELNALEPPPASPFTFDITVTMTNDAGQTASGTITFRTEYLRIDPATQHSATGGSGADG